jgi:hypothetical protein
MRAIVAVFVLASFGLLFASGVNLAQDKKDKKEVVLKGLICCNKCELGEGKECATVIQVKTDKDKDKKGTIYFFEKASHTKFHDDICSGAKEGTVTGFVKDVDKKKVITVTKVEYKQ